MSDTLVTAQTLLEDLSGFKPFRREAIELQDELLDYQRDQFDKWAEQVLASIENPHQPLRYTHIFYQNTKLVHM